MASKRVCLVGTKHHIKCLAGLKCRSAHHTLQMSDVAYFSLFAWPSSFPPMPLDVHPPYQIGDTNRNECYINCGTTVVAVVSYKPEIVFAALLEVLLTSYALDV